MNISSYKQIVYQPKIFGIQSLFGHYINIPYVTFPNVTIPKLVKIPNIYTNPNVIIPKLLT